MSLVFRDLRYTSAMARTRDEAARRRVLDSARDLVCELGPRAVTVDAIAAAAGVGRQTIYRWWPTKCAVIMDALAELTDPEPDDLPASAHEAIRLQMGRVARMFASRRGQLIQEVVADAQGDPELAEDFRGRFFAHRRARGAATVARGMASGELRPDLDIDDVLDVLYGPLWLTLLIGHRHIGPRAVDRILALVWPGIVNTDGGDTPSADTQPMGYRPPTSEEESPPTWEPVTGQATGQARPPRT